MEGTENIAQEIQKGMKLAAEFPDIMPDQASEKIKPVYDDIQKTLRVPIVNLIFRTLANYPEYFVNLWQKISPYLRTEAFENASSTLLRHALLESVPNSGEGAQWEMRGDIERLRAFNDTIHYVLPKLLLITTAFEAATFGSRHSEGEESELPKSSTEIPLGAAEGTTKVEMIQPEKASEDIQKLFEAIKKRHGHPLVSSYFRGLANWPNFLEEAWKRLSPVVGSPEFELCKAQLIKLAEAAVAEMTLPPVSLEELSSKQKADVKAILVAFRLKFIPEMLLDATFIKALLDGTTEATSSRFTVRGA